VSLPCYSSALIGWARNSFVFRLKDDSLVSPWTLESSTGDFLFLCCTFCVKVGRQVVPGSSPLAGFPLVCAFPFPQVRSQGSVFLGGSSGNEWGSDYFR